MKRSERNTKMAADPIFSPACELSPCPAIPLLHTLLDEVRAMRLTLKENAATKKTSSKVTSGRKLVNELVIGLQLTCPDQEWTSAEFAAKICCSEAAVRKTPAWKAYQKRLEGDKQNCPRRKGYRENQGDVVAFDYDEESDT